MTGKNFIILYLLICILGVFSFHWFFIDRMMPSECLSTGCAYASDQSVPPQTAGVLLFVLLEISLVVILSFMTWPEDKLKKILGRMFLERKIDKFFNKLILWLKILEKRDPQTQFSGTRI